MGRISCAVLLWAGLAVGGLAQPVSVPQLDRGGGAYVQQFQSPAAAEMRQLPATARPRPPAATVVQQAVPREFLTDIAAAPLPDDWAASTDSAALGPLPDGVAAPSIGTGVTVILTPQTEAELPTVGAGAVII